MDLEDLSPFRQNVLKLLLKMPKGKVTTYKAIAEKLKTRAYRAVGQALRGNPWPEKYPCFKVVNSDGTLGGFVFGAKEKINRLMKEGIRVEKGRILDFREKLA